MRATEAAGAPNPSNPNTAELVDGIRGRAGHFPGSAPLAYRAAGNLNSSKGGVSFWLRSPLDGRHGGPQDFTLFEAPNSMRIWLGPPPYSRADFPGETLLRVSFAGHKWTYFVPEIVEWWRQGEWKHLIVNWDSSTGSISAAVSGVFDNSPVKATAAARPVGNPPALLQYRSASLCYRGC